MTFTVGIHVSVSVYGHKATCGKTWNTALANWKSTDHLLLLRHSMQMKACVPVHFPIKFKVLIMSKLSHLKCRLHVWCLSLASRFSIMLLDLRWNSWKPHKGFLENIFFSGYLSCFKSWYLCIKPLSEKTFKWEARCCLLWEFCPYIPEFYKHNF